MGRIPIVRVDEMLLVVVQDDLYDRDAIELQENLAETVQRTGSRGVLLDLSVVETVDSFLGRLLNEIALGMRLLGAETVIAGMQPAVAITLVELGLQFKGIRTALNAEKGLALLRRILTKHDRSEDSSGR